MDFVVVYYDKAFYVGEIISMEAGSGCVKINFLKRRGNLFPRVLNNTIISWVSMPTLKQRKFIIFK